MAKNFTAKFVPKGTAKGIPATFKLVPKSQPRIKNPNRVA